MIANAAFGFADPALLALRVVQSLVALLAAGVVLFVFLKQRQREGREQYNWFLQRGNARLEADRLARQREQRYGARSWE